MLALQPYTPQQRAAVETVLKRVGWEERYIAGQMAAITTFADDPLSHVIVALWAQSVVGYVSIQSYRWNRLAQIHGLVVDSPYRRRGIARALVNEAEVFARSQQSRGVYLDTPVTNHDGRRFYAAIGYQQDYLMTRYYADDLDGVTYVKFFTQKQPSTTV